jgi:cell division GTPase FtsZ
MTSTKKQNPTIKVIGIGEKMQNTLSTLQTKTNVEVQLITKAEELEKLKKSTLTPCMNILLIITNTDDEYMDWANDIAGTHKNPERLTLGIIITDNADSINSNESDFDGIFRIKKDDLSSNASYSNKVFTIVNELSKISSIQGYINIDLEDVKTCLKNAVAAILTTAKASGNNRAKQAIIKAVAQLTEEHYDIRYANNILLNIYSGKEEANMVEISIIIDYIYDFCKNKKVIIIWGVAPDESLTDELCIILIASNMKQEDEASKYAITEE